MDLDRSANSIEEAVIDVVVSGEVDEDDEHLLARAETKIERALASAFYVTGIELRRIRDQRLYRSNHTSFKEYCRERWGWSEAHVTRLIQAAQVVEALPRGKGSPRPTSEKHVRPLLKLPDPGQRAEAWRSAIEKSETDGKPVTARRVATVVQRLLKDTDAGVTSSREFAPAKRRTGKKHAHPLKVAYAELSDFRGSLPGWRVEDIDVLYLGVPSADLPGAARAIEEMDLVYRDCGVAALGGTGDGLDDRSLALVLRATTGGVPLPEPRLGHGSDRDLILKQIERLHPHDTRLLLDVGNDCPGWDAWRPERPRTAVTEGANPADQFDIDTASGGSHQDSAPAETTDTTTSEEQHGDEPLADMEDAISLEPGHVPATGVRDTVSMQNLPPKATAAIAGGLEYLPHIRDKAGRATAEEALRRPAFLAFLREVGEDPSRRISKQMRKKPVVAFMAQTWAVAPEKAKVFWTAVRWGDTEHEPCSVLHSLVRDKSVWEEYGRPSRKRAVSQQERYDQCAYCWETWLSGRQLSKSFCETGIVPEQIV